ncbi:MAG TPA: hypothetical protein VFQ85_00915 [Mycobacteriales bacterium]|jgi:hypothetical protein|nr:hypothetical protein [Mycobacteriales bacterium]
MRAFLALAALAAALPFPSAHATAAPPDRLLVVVTPGFSWQAPPPPELAALVDASAVGALVPATGRRTYCATDFWLTFSAGARAALPGTSCGAVDWPEMLRANASRHYGARPGALAASLAATRRCVMAYGPLARVAATLPDGTVPPGPCGVVVREVGSPAEAAAAVRFADDHPVLVVGWPPPGGHYGAVALLGGHGLLRGGDTGTDGLLTIPDLHRYVVTGDLAIAPGSYRRLLDLDRAGHLHRRYAGVYLTGLIALPLLLYIVLGLRRSLGRPLRPVALLLAAYPAAGFLVSLVPWWRAGVPWLACGLGVAAAAALLAIVGRTEVGVAAACGAVLLADLLTGARLERYGLASYSALNGGRYSGLGNTGFAVLATCAVVVAGWLARRYGRLAWPALLLPVTAVDALPGKDFGGAAALLAALAAGVATRARRAFVLAATAAGLAVSVAVAAADYARPAADRTHLGRFVGEVLHGGAGNTLARKAGAALHSVTGTWYPLLVVGSLWAAVAVLRRLRGDETVLPTARALAALWLVGSLLNDSGAMVAGVGMAVAVPLLVAYAVRREGVPW